MSILIILLIAYLIEVVIQAIKPLWGGAQIGKLSVTEIVSMVVGMGIAVVAKLNLFAEFNQTDNTFLLYVFYLITGFAMGRGASFVHDLWLKLRSNYGDGLPVIYSGVLDETAEITKTNKKIE